MTTENAVLQFQGYRVNRMHFELSEGFKHSSDPIELNPVFNRKIQQIADDTYEITLEVELQQSTLPFAIDLSLTGRFTYAGNMDAQKMLKTNAVAILYPYVRSTLSLMTTLAGISPITIPTINLAAMFEREEKQQADSLENNTVNQ